MDDDNLVFSGNDLEDGSGNDLVFSGNDLEGGSGNDLGFSGNDMKGRSENNFFKAFESIDAVDDTIQNGGWCIKGGFLQKRCVGVNKEAVNVGVAKQCVIYTVDEETMDVERYVRPEPQIKTVYQPKYVKEECDNTAFYIVLVCNIILSFIVLAIIFYLFYKSYKKNKKDKLKKRNIEDRKKRRRELKNGDNLTEVNTLLEHNTGHVTDDIEDIERHGSDMHNTERKTNIAEDIERHGSDMHNTERKTNIAENIERHGSDMHNTERKTNIAENVECHGSDMHNTERKTNIAENVECHGFDRANTERASFARDKRESNGVENKELNAFAKHNTEIKKRLCDEIGITKADVVVETPQMEICSLIESDETEVLKHAQKTQDRRNNNPSHLKKNRTEQDEEKAAKNTKSNNPKEPTLVEKFSIQEQKN